MKNVYSKEIINHGDYICFLLSLEEKQLLKNLTLKSKILKKNCFKINFRPKYLMILTINVIVKNYNISMIIFFFLSKIFN